MSKFTEGPWHVDESGECVVDSQGNQLAWGWLDSGEETEANIRLMAASPDLLEACQAFVAAWDKSHQLEKTDAALRLARIAIEKATGEKP